MITDADGQLASRFAAMRDGADDSDWADVLRRRNRVAGRRFHVRTLVIAFALILALGVPTALAFGAVRDFFFGTPAPQIIRGAFAGDNQMRNLIRQYDQAHHLRLRLPPAVDSRKAYGVIAIDTSDGPLLLWAAPAATHKQCWFVEFARDQIGHKRATGGGTCERGAPPPSKIDWEYGWSIAHPTLNVLSGRVYVPAATVDVIARDKRTNRMTSYRLPVVHSYFLAALPREIATPKKLVARRADGTVAAEVIRP